MQIETEMPLAASIASLFGYLAGNTQPKLTISHLQLPSHIPLAVQSTLLTVENS